MQLTGEGGERGGNFYTIRLEDPRFFFRRVVEVFYNFSGNRVLRKTYTSLISYCLKVAL